MHPKEENPEAQTMEGLNFSRREEVLARRRPGSTGGRRIHLNKAAKRGLAASRLIVKERFEKPLPLQTLWTTEARTSHVPEIIRAIQKNKGLTPRSIV